MTSYKRYMKKQGKVKKSRTIEKQIEFRKNDINMLLWGSVLFLTYIDLVFYTGMK